MAGAERNAQSQAWGLVGSLEGKPWAWCRSWWVATAARLCDWSGQLLDQQPSDTSHQKIPLSSLPSMMQAGPSGESVLFCGILIWDVEEVKWDPSRAKSDSSVTHLVLVGGKVLYVSCGKHLVLL